MTTEIRHIARHILGPNDEPWHHWEERPDDVETWIGALLQLMQREPLEPDLAECMIDLELGADGCRSFCGNFANLSAGFWIRTDDPAMIARLHAATIANMGTDGYRDALRTREKRRAFWAAHAAKQRREVRRGRRQ